MQEVIWQQVLPLLPLCATGVPVTATARPDFGLDPLDFVEVVLQVEQHFGIRFSAAELSDLRTVHLLLREAGRPVRRQLYAEFFAQLLQKGHWV